MIRQPLGYFLCGAIALFLFLPSRGLAVFINDGSLTIDIQNDGQFNEVTLNGTAIDTSSFLQTYVVSGLSGFGGGSAVNVVGNVATYTATAGQFGVSATNRILGPLASNPLTTNVLQQRLVFTNNGTAAQALRIVSNMDPDLKNTAAGDTVAFNVARQAVYSVEPTQLMAAIAFTDGPNAIAGHDVGVLGTESNDFPMLNRNGPTGPDDTAMTIGYNLGSVPAGQSRTIEFRYLFSTNLSNVPGDFVIPEPASLMLVVAAAFISGAGFWRPRRGA